jgi:2-methylisocitrate lyase-like PEP mutase family enzyme
MANMVEGGKTPILSTASRLQAIGFSLVIFPRRHRPRHRPCTAQAFYATLCCTATAPARRLSAASMFDFGNALN